MGRPVDRRRRRDELLRARGWRRAELEAVLSAEPPGAAAMRGSALGQAERSAETEQLVCDRAVETEQLVCDRAVETERPVCDEGLHVSSANHVEVAGADVSASLPEDGRYATLPFESLAELMAEDPGGWYAEEREGYFHALEKLCHCLQYTRKFWANTTSACGYLRADSPVVQRGFRWKVMPEELREDRNFVLDVVRSQGFELAGALPSFRADREVVKEAVKANGLALQFAFADLRDDREIVWAAIQGGGIASKDLGYGSALQYASQRLRTDRDFVLDAVLENGSALIGADTKFKDDREIVLAAVGNPNYDAGINSFVLAHASEAMMADPAIVLIALRTNGSNWMDASEALLQNREFMLRALAENSEVGAASIYDRRDEYIEDFDVYEYKCNHLFEYPENEAPRCRANIQGEAVSLRMLPRLLNLNRDQFKILRSFLMWTEDA